MSSEYQLKTINIQIDKSDKRLFRSNKYQLVDYNKIFQLLNPNNTIVDISNQDFSQLYKRYNKSNIDCNIIKYIKSRAEALNLRKQYSDPNIVIYNTPIDYKELKENSADVMIAQNVLGNSKENNHLLKEIKRILKPDGRFFIIELVSPNKPYYGFKSYFKKHKKHIFNNIIFNFQKKLKKLTKCEYDIKIIGNGNFYFNSSDINSLQEFCDILGYESNERQNILNSILTIIIEGKLTE